jgi:hypothetical protein
MKLSNVKAMVLKGVTAGLLGGAFALAVPAKADAQVVVVRPAYPHYVRPYYGGYYAWHRPVRVYPYRYGYHRW